MFKTVPYKLTALREWNIRMSQFETPEIFDPVMNYVLREQGFDTSSSHEPRSVYSCEKLYSQLQGFDSSKSVFVDMSSCHVQRGIAFAYKLFAKPQDREPLKPTTFYDERIISNWKASAGLTAFGLSKREAFSRGTNSVERLLSESRKPEPCIALTRTAKGGKSRLVWGYPMSMTLLEGSVARPLLEQFKGGVTPMAFATTNKTLGAKILSASQNNKYWYSLDASQFDATIQASIIKVAFNIIRSWFDLSTEYYEEKTVGDVFNIIEDYFIHTPIVMPTGNKKVRGQGILHQGKRHGVPSGSYFTQLIDSISNIIVLGTLSSKFGFMVNQYDCFVLGDDLLFFTNSKLQLEPLAEYASSAFGMKFNDLKSELGKTNEPVPFLGRVWKLGIPTRDTNKAMDRMLWPETYRKYVDPRREGRIVALSYNLSAVQDEAFIPGLIGWRSRYLRLTDIITNSPKLSGYFRYMLSHTDYQDQFRKNSGSLNMLRVLL